MAATWAPWTSREDAIIEAEYPFGGMAHVQPKLPGRTPTAIRKRANLLGVKAKLSADDRRLIIALTGSLSQPQLAEKFGVHKDTIRAVQKTEYRSPYLRHYRKARAA